MSSQPFRLLVLVCLAGTVAGCTVGPDFVRPPAPHAQRYTLEPTPETLAVPNGKTRQRVDVGGEVAARWWALFHSPALDEVLHQAVADNRSLAAARATLAAAKANAAAARGGFYPEVDVSAGAQRSKSSQMRSDSGAPAPTGSRIGNLYSIGPTVSYSFEAFGATRRRVEQQQALADKQRYELAAAWLTLTGDSVTQAVTIAELRALIAATKSIIAGDRRNLALVRMKYQAGKAALTDVLSAQTQLAGDRTSLPPLQQQLAAARHVLSILVGRSPAQWSPPSFELADFSLPARLPLSLPSALVRQRPDILAAEAQLHADSAAIGVATAQMYPQLTLSASLGQQSPATGTLFDAVNSFWNLATGLGAPLFHGGTLNAQRQAAVETYRASLAAYQQTVLLAFQQVADTLQALQHDAELIADEHQLLVTSGTALELQRESYAAGKSNLLNLIDAQRSYQQARLAYVRAQTQQLLDSAQLFLSLGGGWWNEDLTADRNRPSKPNYGR